jgi:hypothetical protein
MPAHPSNLWLTLAAAPRSVLCAWLGWTLASALAAWLVAGAVGPAGLATAIAVAGACLARRLPSPDECAHRHHVDDFEAMRIGPGRVVQRLEWCEVVRCAQTRRALVLSGGGRRISLPLAALVEGGAWGPVLARVVPGRAEALWHALESGAVVLRPQVEPALPSVLAWEVLPMLGAALACGSPALALVGAGLIALERLVVHVRRRLRTVVLQPGGLVVPGSHGRFFASWDCLTLEPSLDGLLVRTARGSGVVPADVDDFWAAAAVIELHAQIGFSQPDLVRFRVHLDGAEIAVVGEVDAA